MMIEFARTTWPAEPPQKVLSRWWFQSDFAAATAAVDLTSQRVAAVCIGVPSSWRMANGDNANCISICGWYVRPEYAGRGVGQLLVRHFEASAALLNTLSISAAAVRSFAKLGWAGPFRTYLRILPVPALRRQRICGAIEVRSHRASANGLPAALADALDFIERTKPASQLRSSRFANIWQARLRVRPKRQYDFHILYAGETPFGYFAVRATDYQAGPRYRMARLHYVADAVFNQERTDLLRAAFEALSVLVPLSAGAILYCTNTHKLAAAASDSGWLDDGSPLIGASLTAKAPLYMLGGRFGNLASSDIRLTFADSDIDFNI